uniref:RNA helicase aquarius N-terminal domain-containing protein n=1 Tax=Phlebotomus papatasi TaxID=29031 RepID=A0A1B0D9S2_PHLPP
MTKKDSSAPQEKGKATTITVAQINADRINLLANQYWAPHTASNHDTYNPEIIEDIYFKEIRDIRHSVRRIMMLEFSQYLENYLWPNYRRETASHAHMMSIVFMLNEKFRERVSVWKCFEDNSTEFPGFFQQCLESCLSNEKPTATFMREQTALLLFLNHCFNSMEVELCREQAKRLVSLTMWSCLQPRRREQELRAIPEWKKFWKKLQKRDKPEMKEKLEWERHFLQKLMIKFMGILDSISIDGEISEDVIRYCERFLELLIDLEALLPTRRFFNTVLDDCHLVVRCHLSNLAKREEGKLFTQVSQIFFNNLHKLTTNYFLTQ